MSPFFFSDHVSHQKKPSYKNVSVVKDKNKVTDLL